MTTTAQVDRFLNECILVFAEPAALIHRTHRWIWAVLGRLPAEE